MLVFGSVVTGPGAELLPFELQQIVPVWWCVVLADLTYPLISHVTVCSLA